MSEQLYKVTEFFGITIAVFTCSRDNAKPNDCLLHDFEKKVQEQYENLDDHEQAQYYLRFKVSNGDIRCFAHIINLAVQAGEESCGIIFMSCTICFVCCSAENNQSRTVRAFQRLRIRARLCYLHPQYKSSSTVSCLQKIRILTLVFGRRRQFKDALEKQCRALGIKHYSIPIDMPVRWSSTHTMIDKFYRMKDAIIAVLASQSFDDSIKEVELSKSDWAVTKELLDFFGLFVKTTTMMQADNYPTLNRTLPEYFRLISRLEAVKDSKDKPCKSDQRGCCCCSWQDE